MPISPLTDMPGPPLTPPRVDGPAGSLGQPELTEGRALSGAQTTLAIVVALALIGLGVANIVTRARLHEVEDGVLVIRRIHVVFTLKDVAADKVAAAERSHDVFKPKCPIYRSLHRAIDITSELNLEG